MDYVRCLRDLRMALTVTGLFFFMWGMFLPFNYALLQAKAAGMSPGLVPYLLPIMSSVRYDDPPFSPSLSLMPPLGT